MDTVHVATREDWRRWLARHGATAEPVWLVVHRKGSGAPGLRYDDAVEEALCFGWIDSQALRRDGESCLRFSRRGPKSTWSKVNRERAERMVAQGRMTRHGQAAIDHAKATGTWAALAEAQDLVIPADLRALLDADERALRNYESFPPSSRRLILEWILKARRPETRRRRVEQTVALAARNLRPRRHRS